MNNDNNCLRVYTIGYLGTCLLELSKIKLIEKKKALWCFPAKRLLYMHCLLWSIDKMMMNEIRTRASTC